MFFSIFSTIVSSLGGFFIIFFKPWWCRNHHRVPPFAAWYRGDPRAEGVVAGREEVGGVRGRGLKGALSNVGPQLNAFSWCKKTPMSL